MAASIPHSSLTSLCCSLSYRHSLGKQLTKKKKKKRKTYYLRRLSDHDVTLSQSIPSHLSCAPGVSGAVAETKKLASAGEWDCWNFPLSCSEISLLSFLGTLLCAL